jgi:hypothetical protein
MLHNQHLAIIHHHKLKLIIIIDKMLFDIRRIQDNPIHREKKKKKEFKIIPSPTKSVLPRVPQEYFSCLSSNLPIQVFLWQEVDQRA